MLGSIEVIVEETWQERQSEKLTRLNNSVSLLKVVATLPIPEPQATIVTCFDSLRAFEMRRNTTRNPNMRKLYEWEYPYGKNSKPRHLLIIRKYKQ